MLYSIERDDNMMMNGKHEWVRILEKAVMVYFKVLSQNLSKEIDKSHDKSHRE
jgi:hypothetical protein